MGETNQPERRTANLTARLVLVGLVLAAALSTALAGNWKTDNRTETWMVPGPERDRFQSFVETFGGDETLLVSAFSGPNGHFDDATLDWLDRLGPRLEELPAVDRVLDPLHLPLAPAGPVAERLAAAHERPIIHALGALSSTRIDWILAIRADASPEERGALSLAWSALDQTAAAAGIELVAAGHPLVAAALDHETARVDQVFAPALVLAALCACALFLRSIVLALLAVLPAVVASSCARATLAALAWKSNLILVSVGPLALVLLVASLLHLITRWQRLVGAGTTPREAARKALTHVLPAALFAGGSTALGFLAFWVSGIEAVRRLGLAVGLTVLLAIPLVYWIVTACLAGLPARTSRGPSHKLATGRWRAWALGARRHRRLVLAVSLVIGLLGPLAATALDFGTNALDYFPRGSAIKTSFERLESSGARLTTMEVLLDGLGNDPTTWRAVGSELEAVPGIDSTFGPEDVADDLHAVLGTTPEFLFEPALGLALVEAGRRGTAPEAPGAPASLRWTLRFANAGAEQVGPLEARVARTLASIDLEYGTKSAITGSLLGALGMQQRLVRTLGLSLGATLLVTAALFLLVMRRVRLLGIVLAVNLLPVSAVFLAAFAFGYRLDASTVMVAAIVLGLVVDNTFHLLFAAGDPAHAETDEHKLSAFDLVGQAAFISSLTLMLGFLTLGLAGFAPTAHFGLLVAVGIAVGMVADFQLLPALWLRRADEPTEQRP